MKILNMKEEDKKSTQVPNLRFPEFEGEWVEKKLGEIANFFSGGTPATTNKDYYDGTISFIRSGEINSETTELFISEQGLKKSSAKMVNKGDLLLALYGATSGEIAISKIYGAINQAILCVRTEENKYFLQGVWLKSVGKILESYLQGGQGNLSAEIVKKISFYFPKIEEQRKIARFLTLIDQRIETQSKIIEKLESLIRGLCEKMFCGLRNTPALRFPSYQDVWQKVKLKDVVSRVTRKNKNNETGLALTIAAQYGLVDQVSPVLRTLCQQKKTLI